MSEEVARIKKYMKTFKSVFETLRELDVTVNSDYCQNCNKRCKKHIMLAETEKYVCGACCEAKIIQVALREIKDKLAGLLEALEIKLLEKASEVRGDE